MRLEALHATLRGVSAYKNVTAEPLLQGVLLLLSRLERKDGPGALDAYTDVFYTLRQEGRQGLGEWLHDALRYSEAPYPMALERGEADPALETAARRDIESFLLLAQLDCDDLLDRLKGILPDDYGPVIAMLPRWQAEAPFSFASLRTFYQNHGCGSFARYRAFLWENGALMPIPDPDCAEPAELLGYEIQRQAVVDNTRAMMEGHCVNNVLLYGDSGTGKSATVKALLAAPGFEDLRLIELSKRALGELPTLIRSLAGRRQKFVLFIDDLAFDQDDRTYSALKTILEGGLEKRPANVAIYATSNRRNLVRQTFSDRAGDEVEVGETIAEKTSLAERFGLRVAYLSLNKGEFLDLVAQMAELYGVTIDPEQLRMSAVKWEMHHPGRTPRTARQFISSLCV